MEFFKDAILRCAREVFGSRKVGLGRKSRGNNWWSEEVREPIRFKRNTFGHLLQNRSEGNTEEQR